MGRPKTPQPSAEQKRLEQLQLQELERLRGIEDRKKAQLARSRRGRASLVTGSERGVVELVGG